MEWNLILTIQITEIVENKYIIINENIFFIIYHFDTTLVNSWKSFLLFL